MSTSHPLEHWDSAKLHDYLKAYDKAHPHRFAAKFLIRLLDGPKEGLLQFCGDHLEADKPIRFTDKQKTIIREIAETMPTRRDVLQGAAMLVGGAGLLASGIKYDADGTLDDEAARTKLFGLHIGGERLPEFKEANLKEIRKQRGDKDVDDAIAMEAQSQSEKTQSRTLYLFGIGLILLGAGPMAYDAFQHSGHVDDFEELQKKHPEEIREQLDSCMKQLEQAIADEIKAQKAKGKGR